MREARRPKRIERKTVSREKKSVLDFTLVAGNAAMGFRRGHDSKEKLEMWDEAHNHVNMSQQVKLKAVF